MVRSAVISFLHYPTMVDYFPYSRYSRWSLLSLPSSDPLWLFLFVGCAGFTFPTLPCLALIYLPFFILARFSIPCLASLCLVLTLSMSRLRPTLLRPTLNIPSPYPSWFPSDFLLVSPSFLFPPLLYAFPLFLYHFFLWHNQHME